MSTTTAERSEYTFQTEIKQLLHLLSHSLYQNREITIRELVSNASDALDKLHHLRLTDENLREDESPLEITLVPDREAKTLEIRDTGVGMNREELVENLGTIAHSGSLAFLNQLSGDADTDLSLIGQFGVGFYSSFMAADRVEVFSRSCRDETGWRWESDGTGSFTIEPAEVDTHGTRVVLHLKDDFAEFTDPHRLRAIVQRYSSFVRHPIKLVADPEQEPEQLNEQRPIWVEPKSQLDDEQYNAFYQHLTHRVSETPLWHLHLSADSPLQFHAILYCPRTSFEKLGFGKTDHGIHLCAKRILVQDDNRDLLPEYLRFLYGLVDSDDLPLNVSRQALQDDAVFRKIRKVLVKRVLDQLRKLAEDDAEKYRTFHEEFGGILREGIATDFENRERIAKLLRFHSTKAEGNGRVSLEDYVSRAGEEQKSIYYLTGTSLDTMRRSPNLEVFRARDIEVLLLTDPVDEIVLGHLGEFDGKELVSIESADLELPETKDAAQPESEEKSEESQDTGDENRAPNFEQLLVLVREAVGEDVQEVRESKRLTDSPCCLVTPSGSVGSQLQKMLAMSDREFQMEKRIFELNPRHPFVRRLGELVRNPDNAGFVKDCARQLLANAMLQEGFVPSPEDVANRSQRFMEELARGRSSVIT